jgi:predicted  nucleic acid-binding Zn-ribbon protein
MTRDEIRPALRRMIETLEGYGDVPGPGMSYDEALRALRAIEDRTAELERERDRVTQARDKWKHAAQRRRTAAEARVEVLEQRIRDKDEELLKANEKVERMRERAEDAAIFERTMADLTKALEASTKRNAELEREVARLKAAHHCGASLQPAVNGVCVCAVCGREYDAEDRLT